MNGNRETDGFTLIELLVVISIVALLLAVLMPALNRAKESAKRVICSTGLRQVAFGILMYANDYKKTPSWGWQFNEDNWTSPTQRQLDDFAKDGKIWPYVEDQQVFLCPSRPKQFKAGIYGHSAFLWGWNPGPRWTYVINSTPGIHDDPKKVLPNGLPDWGFKISGINPSPDHVVMIFEQDMGDYNAYDNSIEIFGVYNESSNIGSDTPASYHSEGGNFAYYDGHVEWEKRMEFLASISTCAGFIRRCGPSDEYRLLYPCN